ncbi:MAG: 30S ribosomal protein S20 [Phycisphaeraceae bacterium]|nr:30S ribosomal protein S20 [Phycisphaeraceae bacterium]
MAHSLSARKRVRQNATCRARNRWRKDRVRSAIKDYHESILHGSVEDCQSKLKSIYKMLDQVSSTAAMHKNTAARRKSRLAAALNAKQKTAAKA